MDSIPRTFAAVVRRFETASNGAATPGITKRGALTKRDLAGGPIAGIVIGVIVFVALLCLCSYPVIVGTVRRRRHRRQREKFDTEAGAAHDAPPEALSPGYDRRLSSTDSVKPNDESSRGELAPTDGKDDGQRNFPAAAGAPYDWESQMVHASPSSLVAQDPGQGLAQHTGTEQMTPFPAYDGGVYYPGADPSEPRGENADYYSPSIPSEAFGMYPIPSPTEQSEGSKARLRGSSLRNSVKDMLRRASGRDRTMSSTTSGDGEQSGSAGPAPLQTMLPNQDPTDSPTEMSPITSTSPTAHLPSTSRALGSSIRGLSEDGYTPPPPSAERGFKYSPPVNAGPGTVNPMDIMPASSEPERWHRTDHDLYLAAHQPPSAPVSPTAESISQFSPVVETAPATSASPSPLPLHIQEPTRHNTDQTIKQETFQQPPDDVEMTNALSQNYLHPDPDPGRHLSYPSDQSTPFPGLASTNPSSHNTPSTQNTDTPSPESSGVASDFRHSVSPAASNASTHHGQGRYACRVPDCGQVFDQHHKLNHHARYHAKEHRCEYAGCGKGFGTKTHLQRHINDRHLHSKKFHCAIPSCEYSRAGGKSFLRKDNWKRHMTRIHHVEQKDLPEPVEYETMAES